MMYSNKNGLNSTMVKTLDFSLLHWFNEYMFLSN